MVGFDREQASTTTSKAARAAMRTAPQLLVTGGPASDDPSDNGRPVELRYDAALRRIAAEQASLRSAAAPPGDNEDMATALPRRPSSAAPVLRKGEPYLRAVSSRPGSAARPGSSTPSCWCS